MALDARQTSDIDLPASRVAVTVAAAADWDWHEDASRHGDGDGAEKQEGRYEAS